MKNVLFLMMALTLVSAPALMCEPIPTDAPAYQSKGTVMVPMRAIFEWLGAEVSFDSATGGITAKRGEQIVSLKAGSKTATVNGETKTMSAPAESRNGRTFVPVRFVAEAFGAEVGWDAGSRQVFMSQDGREGTLQVAEVDGPATGNKAQRSTKPRVSDTVLLDCTRPMRFPQCRRCKNMAEMTRTHAKCLEKKYGAKWLRKNIGLDLKEYRETGKYLGDLMVNGADMIVDPGIGKSY